MGVVDRRKRLFQNIVRLRRAQRACPSNRDIVAVRAALEDELGPTVSRRLAASLLGVSHTALARWTALGDLPTVMTKSGRDEIPVASLLPLYEAVEDERRSGTRERHVLEPTVRAEHARADGLDASKLVDDWERHLGADSHGKADVRALAYHRALARRLRRPMVDEALHQIWKWREQGAIDPRYADAWEQILTKPVAEVRRRISEDSPQARDLRQSSPFAGMLSEAERRKILREAG